MAAKKPNPQKPTKPDSLPSNLQSSHKRTGSVTGSGAPRPAKAKPVKKRSAK
jgi:hypothetical protein